MSLMSYQPALPHNEIVLKGDAWTVFYLPVKYAFSTNRTEGLTTSEGLMSYFSLRSGRNSRLEQRRPIALAASSLLRSLSAQDGHYEAFHYFK